MGVIEINEARTLKPAEMTGKTWRIKIIEGDRQGSSAWYPKEVLESQKALFGKGVRSFENHPSANEKWDQPERRIGDIIGWLSEDAEYDGKDLWANLTIKESKREEIKELAEAGVIAISIRASGELVEGTNGMELKKFTAVHSVDVVTTAGAGGAFGEVLESARPNISAPESGAESLEEKDQSTMDPKLAEALDALVEATKANTATLKTLTERAATEDKAKADLAEADRIAAEAAKVLSPLEVAGKLTESELPKAAQARVLALVEAGADLDETIKSEKTYLEEAVKAAGFQGDGSGDTTLEETKTVGSRVFRS